MVAAARACQSEAWAASSTAVVNVVTLYKVSGGGPLSTAGGAADFGAVAGDMGAPGISLGHRRPGAPGAGLARGAGGHANAPSIDTASAGNPTGASPGGAGS